MSEISRIHSSKQGRRPHFIREWADKFNLSQADIVREIGIDKSTVSRWFREGDPSTPSAPAQAALAALFHTIEEALFRHPDEDWLANFFKGRKREEIERIKKTLEAGFPKTGT